ncbi:hypothetical protein AGMMS49928_24830 [Spirochaetia bacterium]|nr:hypothetical protein AGMMS49928_24830 [Spirochaetia bacterium]
MESNVIVNPNCACPNKKCPVVGKCHECRTAHKKPYCESGAVQQAFARFGFKLYDAMAGRKNK